MTSLWVHLFPSSNLTFLLCLMGNQSSLFTLMHAYIVIYLWKCQRGTPHESILGGTPHNFILFWHMLFYPVVYHFCTDYGQTTAHCSTSIVYWRVNELMFTDLCMIEIMLFFHICGYLFVV